MQQFVQRAVRPLVFSALLSLSALAGTGTANALVVLSGSEVLDNIAPANGVTGVSIDRVLSDGFASRWDFVKAYPGTTQANGPFADLSSLALRRLMPTSFHSRRMPPSKFITKSNLRFWAIHRRPLRIWTRLIQ